VRSFVRRPPPLGLLAISGVWAPSALASATVSESSALELDEVESKQALIRHNEGAAGHLA
jgi:hypothetical protein